MNTHFILQKDSKQITFDSNEEDVSLFAFSLQKTFDRNGNNVFVNIRDPEAYYQDVQYLLDESKIHRNQALEELLSGKYKFKYNPKKLIDEFILSPNRRSKRYLTLKNDYFRILSNYAIISKRLLEIQKKTEEEFPDMAERLNLIDEVLMKCFRRGENVIKCYLKYKKYMNLDIDDLTTQAELQSEYIKDLFSMVDKRQNISDEMEIQYTLDAYRRLTELSSNFVNILRICIEFIEGVEEPKLNDKFINNCKLIKMNSKYSRIVEFIDPSIRHSESHINTKVIQGQKMVQITENMKGERKIIAEYQFDEIKDMKKHLERLVLPSLITSFSANEIALFDMILMSPEYLTLLVHIGNKKIAYP